MAKKKGFNTLRTVLMTGSWQSLGKPNKSEWIKYKPRDAQHQIVLQFISIDRAKIIFLYKRSPSYSYFGEWFIKTKAFCEIYDQPSFYLSLATKKVIGYS